MFCLSNAWGGLEKIAADDFLQLVAAGVQAKFVCLEGSPLDSFFKRRRALGVVSLSFRPRNVLDLRLGRWIRSEIKRGCNLIHLHQSSYLGSIVPWCLGKEPVTVVMSRHILSDHSKKSPVHRFLYGRVDGVLTMSGPVKKNIIDTHPLRDSQVHIVPYGLDLTRFDPSKVNGKKTRASWGVSDDELVIGLVGRIDPAKGQSTLIHAAANLLKEPQRSGKLKFVIVGEETRGTRGTLTDLKALVARFRLESYFVFTGYQDQIPDLMAGLDIFVMPSRQETFGLVAIEAMAMGVPTLLSRGGSAVEIAGPSEEFAVLLRPDDPFDLAQKLKMLLSDPEALKRLSVNGMKHVREKFSKERRLEETLRRYYAWLSLKSVIPMDTSAAFL